jgi:hypothetical protein
MKCWTQNRRASPPLLFYPDGSNVSDLFFDWLHADLIHVYAFASSDSRETFPFAPGLSASGAIIWGCSGFDPWFACAAALGG